MKNIFADGELDETSTCKDFLQVQKEGSRCVERQKLMTEPALGI
jgi:hypothetical protein